jgi:phosphatidylserine/phosphatidylglycerophosphate/cardiolipin synthase-like enzyme
VTHPLAKAIAAVAAGLPADHVAAWAAVLERAPGPGPAVEAALIDVRGGYAAASHARQLLAAWRASMPALPGPGVALALRSAGLLEAESAARLGDIAVSGPTSDSVPVRLTSAVVIEVIRAARISLLVVSFAAYGVAEVVTELLAATGRGIRVDLVLEDATQDGGTLRGTTGAADAFARLRGAATFWQWPAARRAASGNPRAALHAKLITADTTLALVSSANLTDRALAHNIEVGVILRDPDTIDRINRHFAALMGPATGVLAPLAK